MNSSPVVIKFGGALAQDAQQLAAVLTQLVALRRPEKPLVIVHGGGKQIRELSKRFGLVERFHEGLRITDGPTLEIVQLGLSQVNRTIVQHAIQLGLPAVGISGVDAASYRATRLAVGADGVDVGYVGRVSHKDPSLLQTLLHAGFLPVVACLAGGSGEAVLNVNADEMAAAVAASLTARTLIYLTDVPGVLDGSGALLEKLVLQDMGTLVAKGVVSGGMLPKLRACQAALDAGVQEVRIVGYQAKGAVARALAGEVLGTLVVKS